MRELGKLTNGEKLLIDRRRRDESQTEAAARLGVGRKIYAQWETDLKEGPKVKGAFLLKLHEVCFLYRHRAGFTRKQVAKDLNVSEWWVTQMERGYPGAECGALVEYWEC